MNAFNIENTFAQKEKNGWEFISIAVDLHGTILHGTRAVGKSDATYYPNAIRVLQLLSGRKDVKLILWTSSHIDTICVEADRLLKLGVNFDAINCNPFVENTPLSNFSKKIYMNIGFDDKFGFCGETDWFLVEKTLKQIGEWHP